jgi:hypothetical protein
LQDFPAHYVCRIDEFVKEYADELRDYVLSMVEVHEADPQLYQRIAPTPEHVLMLALAGFGRRLAERMDNRRESQDALDDLKGELGL